MSDAVLYLLNVLCISSNDKNQKYGLMLALFWIHVQGYPQGWDKIDYLELFKYYDSKINDVFFCLDKAFLMIMQSRKKSL